eukprot:scaffold28198_cov71-Phaeocystis_antarctica.AAC.2
MAFSGAATSILVPGAQGKKWLRLGEELVSRLACALPTAVIVDDEQCAGVDPIATLVCTVGPWWAWSNISSTLRPASPAARAN